MAVPPTELTLTVLSNPTPLAYQLVMLTVEGAAAGTGVPWLSSDTLTISVQVVLTESNVPAGTVTESFPATLQVRSESICTSTVFVALTTVPLAVTFSDQVFPLLKLAGILNPSAVTEVVVMLTFEVDRLRLFAPESNAARFPP